MRVDGKATGGREGGKKEKEEGRTRRGREETGLLGPLPARQRLLAMGLIKKT